MNEFSIVCRILGTLFNRQPQDPILKPLLTVIVEGKLKQSWPLEQDALLDRLQQNCDLSAMQTDYMTLFYGDNASVPGRRFDYTGESENDIRQFLIERGMPLSDGPVDQFGSLLLGASWLEDQAAEDEVQGQIVLFDEYLLPWCGQFLGKVEAHATTGFYRTLAVITREALQALREELDS
ncbi:molecular chaperone [Photorhabdus luminescens subsp. luminescens]|uniref:Chaperone TorD involved in molybdoenzyme TorA maturation n=1 Tax=Photorhabdus luminescens TaxID=29488 RepID=A0A1G5PTE5_PHOLU|nr:molecular chaperone [Photorhabdus luminescens]KMW74824.1 molecular chaperone [Photorhabdus luminescens subsp. luminescens]SCZ52510.1 chaperone TorD involved in molybdoenzyme TorA maturation [Photorhabdus luminescens]